MATCTGSQNFPGKTVLYEFATGCGNDDHLTLPYKLFGTVSSKSLNTAVNTADNTNDQSGAFTSMLATRLDVEISVSGFATSDDSVSSAQAALYNYLYAEMIAGRQPSLWIKKSSANIPFVQYVFCIITTANLNEDLDDPVAIEYSFKTTDTNVPGKSSVILVPVP